MISYRTALLYEDDNVNDNFVRSSKFELRSARVEGRSCWLIENAIHELYTVMRVLIYCLGLFMAIYVYYLT